jgi:hypothetical protein
MCGSLLQYDFLVARKHHRCDHCRTFIEPRTKYNLQVYVDDGEIVTFRAHVECQEDAIQLMEVESDGCFGGTLGEWCSESGYPVEQLGLSPIVQERFQSRQRREDRNELEFLRYFYARRPSGQWADDGGSIDVRKA